MEKIIQSKNCKQCGVLFLKKLTTPKKEWDTSVQFCSVNCRNNSGRITKVCEYCKKSFAIYKCWAHRKFCSQQCSNKVNLPPRQGIITPKICLTCKKEYFRKGKFARDKSKFCSLSCATKGANHWNWKNGKTPLNHLLRKSKEYNEWRKAVYRRDYWTCRMCKVKQKHPVAHHPKNFNDFPDLRYKISNGITLCRSCHKRVHSEIGLSSRFWKIKCA